MPTEITVPLSSLQFDEHNPRLIGEYDGDQDKMFRALITDIGVEDLLESLSTSGWVQADPMIVSSAASGKYNVIEGNRRLAALKLLVGDRPADKLALPPIPSIPPHIAQTFENIPVQINWQPDQLQAYLGYKHVTSSREWAPDAKAKFVLENANGDLSITNLKKFARTLGTKYPALRRWLVAYLVLKQAETAGIFDPQFVRSKNYFGTFYTLLGGDKAQRFLQIKDRELSQNPVQEDNIPELKEFLDWTIGLEGRSPLVNSRQQADFEQVLSSPGALANFRLRGDLKNSLLYTEYNAEQIALKLKTATYGIDECLPKLNDVKDDERVAAAFADLERAYKKAKLNMGGE